MSLRLDCTEADGRPCLGTHPSSTGWYAAPVAAGGRAVRWTLLLLVVVLAIGCERAVEDRPSSSAPIEVRVAHVRRGEITSVLTVTGRTAALSVLRLASPIAGRVTFLSAQPGDRLLEGAVVAKVMPLENDAALHGFGLVEKGAALTPEERDLAERLQRDLRTGDVPLRVPFSALVAARLHNPGEQVTAGDVLLELFDPRSLYVIAQVPLEAAREIQIGMPVEVTSGQARASGEVAAVIPSMAGQAVTVPVRITLSVPLQPPLLDRSVECRITSARHPDALVIPRSALLSSNAGEQGEVMVVAGAHARRRSVQLGLRTELEVEVSSGLGPDDVVVAEGHYALPDGATIQPVPIGQ